MSDLELIDAVAHVTGEDAREIHRRGFVLAGPDTGWLELAYLHKVIAPDRATNPTELIDEIAPSFLAVADVSIAPSNDPGPDSGANQWHREPATTDRVADAGSRPRG